MPVLYLALIGIPVGLALDALIVQLAVAPEEDSIEEADTDEEEDTLAEPEADETGPSTNEASREPSPQPTSVHAEAGALVVQGDKPLISWTRRLLVVGATVGLFAVAGARFSDTSHLAVVTAYVCVLLICAATDALAYRVPNVVTYPALVGALAIGAAMPGADVLEVIAGGALAGGVLLLPALFTGGVGMGMGDVKLVAFVGLALGFANTAPALLFMALGGGAVAVLLLITGLRKRGEPIPYAPFISAGALAVLLWQGTAFVDAA
jgi:Flp pilus assembly protein protease CpaA